MKAELPLMVVAAAMTVCLALLIPYASEAETLKLRADQQRALETMLAEVEPANRPIAREQLTRTLAPFSEAQIAMMMSARAKEQAQAKAAPRPQPVVESRPATPADIAFNRAQANPVIRKSHAAQKAFDDLVDATMAAKCPAPNSIARYGSGWRYDFIALQPVWNRASNSADLDVEVLDQSYVQSDARYAYDFSKVKTSFDKAKVVAAIEQACKEYAAMGRTFLAKLDPLIAAQNWDAAFKLEQTSSSWVQPNKQRLEAVFKEQSPNGDNALFLALLDGKRVN